MKKKVLISLGLIGALVLASSLASAEGLEEALELYLRDPSLDFLGRGFDKILFKEKLSMMDDFKTMPLQLKSMYKIITQKPNIVAYGTLSGTAGFKVAIGAKEFNKIALQILRLIVK